MEKTDLQKIVQLSLTVDYEELAFELAQQKGLLSKLYLALKTGCRITRKRADKLSNKYHYYSSAHFTSLNQKKQVEYFMNKSIAYSITKRKCQDVLKQIIKTHVNKTE